MKHRTLETKMIVLFSLAFLLMLIGLFMADFYIYTNKDQMIKNARMLEAALIHPNEMNTIFNESNHLGGVRAFILNFEGAFDHELFQHKESQNMPLMDRELIGNMINEAKLDQKWKSSKFLEGALWLKDNSFC